MPTPAAGHKLKMYRNTATSASPTWSLVTEVGDVSISDLSMGLAELKRRASNFAKNLPTMIQPIGAEFRLHHGMDSTTFTALRTAFFNGTVMEWAFMDGLIATVGSEGLRSPFFIEQLPWDQSLEEANGHDVRLAGSYMYEGSSEVDASWMVVSA